MKYLNDAKTVSRNQLAIMSKNMKKEKGFLALMNEYRLKEAAKRNKIDICTAQIEASNLWPVSLSCFDSSRVHTCKYLFCYFLVHGSKRAREVRHSGS